MAISPADEIVNLSNDGEACVQCAAPNADSYLLSPKTWSVAALQVLGVRNVLRTWPVVVFTPPANSDVNITSIVKEILELSSHGDFPDTSSELEQEQCVANDSLMVWTNYPTSDEAQEELKKVLDDAVTGAGLTWSVKML